MSSNNPTLSPYLAFDGTCREAMTFYRDVIGGELEFMTFAHMPESNPVPEEHRDRIMHSSLRGNGLLLMASDSLPGQGDQLSNGNSVSLSLATEELAKAEKVFNTLAENGTVKMKFMPVFWGGNFGMVIDRFGMNWMISSEEQSERVEAE